MPVLGLGCLRVYNVEEEMRNEKMGRKLSRQVLGAGETVVQSVVWTQAASLPTAEGIATQVRGRAQSEIQGCILPAFMCSCTMLDSQQRRAGGGTERLCFFHWRVLMMSKRSRLLHASTDCVHAWHPSITRTQII